MRTHYVSAYYYAFTVLTTVGFGDISAHSEAERVVNVIIMVFGAYIFGAFLTQDPTSTRNRALSRTVCVHMCV